MSLDATNESGVRDREPVVLDPPLVPGGCLWPPSGVRLALSEISRLGLKESSPRSWAPQDSREFISGVWVLHSRRNWRFADLSAARVMLSDCVRFLKTLGPWLPERRGVFVVKNPNYWQLWMLTRDARTLRQMFEDALNKVARGAFELALIHWLRVENSLHQHSLPPVLSPRLGDIALTSHHPACLAFPDVPDAPDKGTHSRSALSSALAKLLSTCSGDTERLIDQALLKIGAHPRHHEKINSLRDRWLSNQRSNSLLKDLKV